MRAVLQHHAIEDMAVVWLIDVEHLLHRFAGQTDLFAHDFGAGGFFQFDKCQLDAIGFFLRDGGILFRERPEHRFGLLGAQQFLAFLCDLIPVESCHSQRSIS